MNLKREASPMNVVQTISELDPGLECGSSAWRAYALVVGGLVWGAKLSLVLEKLEMKRTDELSMMARQLRSNGIWRNGRTHLNFKGEPSDCMEITLAVNVALGYMARSKAGTAVEAKA